MPQSERETTCVAIRDRDRLILLDAGTGLRRLVTDPSLGHGVRTIDILLSHFHLDHVVGLTYLTALDEDVVVSIWGPGALLYGQPTSVILDRLMTEPFQGSPLTSHATVRDVQGNKIRIGDIEVSAREQPRHTAPSMAFRLNDTLAYCTDTEYDPDNADFISGCELLLHEAWYTGSTGDNGHSSAMEAAHLADIGNVGQLILVHIAPKVDERALGDEARSVFAASVVGVDLLERDLT